MIKYVVNARSPGTPIEEILKNNKQEIDYFCSRTLDWSINTIIQDDVFDEIIISYYGQLCKEIIDKLSEKSRIPIRTINTNRYFTRTIDDLLFGDDEENLDGIDLKQHIDDNDKIFVAHMDSFFDKSVYQTMISFDRPMVFGTHNYIIFQVDGKYYKWIADNMTLGNVGFLRENSVRFSWNKFTDQKKQKFYDLANTKNIFLSGTQIDKVPNLDGLQEGSIKLAILQYLGQMKATDLVDIGDSNTINDRGVHLKAFFNPNPNSGERFIINNAIIQAVMFGRIQEQKTIIKNHYQYNNIKLKLLDIFHSYFGQKILNNQEQENFNLLLQEIVA